MVIFQLPVRVGVNLMENQFEKLCKEVAGLIDWAQRLTEERYSDVSIHDSGIYTSIIFERQDYVVMSDEGMDTLKAEICIENGRIENVWVADICVYSANWKGAHGYE